MSCVPKLKVSSAKKKKWQFRVSNGEEREYNIFARWLNRFKAREALDTSLSWSSEKRCVIVVSAVRISHLHRSIVVDCKLGSTPICRLCRRVDELEVSIGWCAQHPGSVKRKQRFHTAVQKPKSFPMTQDYSGTAHLHSI